MALGLIGEKCGMTRVFDGGESIPVTVIRFDPNLVTQIKTRENDGYSALQIGVVPGEKSLRQVKSQRVSKALKGHLAKAEVGLTSVLMEFRIEDTSGYRQGQLISVDLFEAGQVVDIFGVSKGKGFQGAIKRWNFRTQDATHGNSLSHRAPGSIGQNQSPGRVFKGKKMAGRMGGEKSVSQALRVVQVRVEDGLLLVRGAVPGATGSKVVIKPSVKR